jgi:hypothetical protein
MAKSNGYTIVYPQEPAKPPARIDPKAYFK